MLGDPTVQYGITQSRSAVISKQHINTGCLKKCKHRLKRCNIAISKGTEEVKNSYESERK